MRRVVSCFASGTQYIGSLLNMARRSVVPSFFKPNTCSIIMCSWYSSMVNVTGFWVHFGGQVKFLARNGGRSRDEARYLGYWLHSSSPSCHMSSVKKKLWHSFGVDIRSGYPGRLRRRLTSLKAVWVNGQGVTFNSFFPHCTLCLPTSFLVSPKCKSSISYCNNKR